MISHYPGMLIHGGRPTVPETAQRRDGAAAPGRVWTYRPSGGARKRLVIAMLCSIGIHAAAFLGIGRVKEPKVAPVREETPTVQLRMPDLTELEETRPTSTDAETRVDPTSYAPMQPDLPQVATSADFVQRIDFASLVEKPDLSRAKVFVIPTNIDRTALRHDLGPIFNLAELDRVPQAMVQPPPIYPTQYRREGMTAEVVVQFIVDTSGAVVDAFAVRTTHPGFNDAAVSGVSKWKFTAGIKNGRRVNTRMQVPIVFTLQER